jgi:hypothetical protein
MAGVVADMRDVTRRFEELKVFEEKARTGIPFIEAGRPIEAASRLHSLLSHTSCAKLAS